MRIQDFPYWKRQLLVFRYARREPAAMIGYSGASSAKFFMLFTFSQVIES